MTRVKVGQSNLLTVIKESSLGYFFDGGEDGNILMPNRHKPDHELAVGDNVDVFVFHDSEERLTATVKFPVAQIGEIVFLKVIDKSRFGAYLEWGLSKDLFVPESEQYDPMELGASYFVRILLDNHGRIMGSSYFSEDIEEYNKETFSLKQEVMALIIRDTEMGWKAIINNTHWGIIFHNETFKKINIGQVVKAYVKNIREDDKIDLSLVPIGFNPDHISDLGKQILDKIDFNKGFLPITDKSSPEEIHQAFEVSKKSFKQAVGFLYRERMIIIQKDGLRRS
ncbi:MAG: GntR family transcriptional regulator [Candidatus Sericytochromatia bacterium]|nr:GntR family transcriptional regulator [Candidatus Sericytochromatia bacterium]